MVPKAKQAYRSLVVSKHLIIMSYTCSFEQLDPHEQISCGYKKGGISAMAVLKSGHGITDFSNATQVHAAITAGKLVIIGGIKGIVPDASPIEGENPVACGAETILDGFNLTTTWKDFNISNTNNEFYRQLNNSAFEGLVLYYCQQDEVEVISKSVTFVALPPTSPESNKEKRFYNITAKYTKAVGDAFNHIYDAPVGIFS